MCFGCSKEPSYGDGSFEYPQHMFWLRNKNYTFQFRTLTWRPAHNILFCLSVSLEVIESDNDFGLYLYVTVINSLWDSGIITNMYDQ